MSLRLDVRLAGQCCSLAFEREQEWVILLPSSTGGTPVAPKLGCAASDLPIMVIVESQGVFPAF
jgi:hypothetical protein